MIKNIWIANFFLVILPAQIFLALTAIFQGTGVSPWLDFFIVAGPFLSAFNAWAYRP